MVKHEEEECLSPLCKICQSGHHTLICRFEEGEMIHVEPQNENGPDYDDSFNGFDSTKSDQKNTYICVPRKEKSNDEEVVKGNNKRSPGLEDEDVPEIWEVEVGIDALVTIGGRDLLIEEKAREVMEDTVLEDKFITKRKPSEGEKKHESRTEERTPLIDCKEKYFTLQIAYLDKIKWFKSLASQLGSEIEETTPVEDKEASDIKMKEKTSEMKKR